MVVNFFNKKPYSDLINPSNNNTTLIFPTRVAIVTYYMRYLNSQKIVYTDHI